MTPKTSFSPAIWGTSTSTTIPAMPPYPTAGHSSWVLLLTASPKRRFPPTGTWPFSVCDDPDGGTTTNLSTATATIDLDVGEIIACTFTNTIPVSVTTAAGTGVVTFESDKGVIQDLTAVSEGTLTCPAEGKPDLVFVHSFFSFSITGLTPCASETVVVTITLPSAVPVDTEYWKCHDGAWLDVTSLLGENDGDNVLTLTLTDGGLGDDDGVCDGVIVDDGGPGQEPPVPIGGIAVSVNKLELLPSWMGMAALASLVALTVALVRRRGGA